VTNLKKIVRKLLSYLGFEVMAVVIKKYLVGYNTLQSTESQPTFWRKMLPPPSGLHGVISQEIELFTNKLSFLANFILKFHLCAGRKLKTLQLLHGSYIRSV
jgi:hypothetical protein